MKFNQKIILFFVVYILGYLMLIIVNKECKVVSLEEKTKFNNLFFLKTNNHFLNPKTDDLSNLKPIVFNKDSLEKKQKIGNNYYLKLDQKLKLYSEIKKNGGFPEILTSAKKISVNDKDSCIGNLKKYLVITGDLKINDETNFFTHKLEKAVKRFQQRMGLKEDGVIGAATFTELNKTIDYRIKQIQINMERLKWFPEQIESHFIIINIPEYKLHVFENKKQAWETKVVVGKEATKTNIFKGNISEIILNPYWNVPKSIINKEILPKLKRNPSYIYRNNMEVLSGGRSINPYAISWRKYRGNVPFAIRQKPGDNNALGKIKFNFPNSYSIYLHDTPSKSLFNESKRAFSHGCIRIQEPRKLALYLLRKDQDWDAAKIDTIIKSNKNYTIKLKTKMPVYIVYFTAWVDENKTINFRNDLYHLDQELEKKTFSELKFLKYQ